MFATLAGSAGPRVMCTIPPVLKAGVIDVTSRHQGLASPSRVARLALQHSSSCDHPRQTFGLCRDAEPLTIGCELRANGIDVEAILIE
jgi:hypothetical protein